MPTLDEEDVISLQQFATMLMLTSGNKRKKASMSLKLQARNFNLKARLNEEMRLLLSSPRMRENLYLTVLYHACSNPDLYGKRIGGFTVTQLKHAAGDLSLSSGFVAARTAYSVYDRLEKEFRYVKCKITALKNRQIRRYKITRYGAFHLEHFYMAFGVDLNQFDISYESILKRLYEFVGQHGFAFRSENDAMTFLKYYRSEMGRFTPYFMRMIDKEAIAGVEKVYIADFQKKTGVKLMQIPSQNSKGESLASLGAQSVSKRLDSAS